MKCIWDIYSTRNVVPRSRSRQSVDGKTDTLIESSNAHTANQDTKEKKHPPRRNSLRHDNLSEKSTRRTHSGHKLHGQRTEKSGGCKALGEVITGSTDTRKKMLSSARPLIQSDQSSVFDCVKMMVRQKTDAALLVDAKGSLTGILTDSDIAYKVVAMGRDPKMFRVCEVMTPNPSCVAPNANPIDALNKMISGKFRHLPVADNEKIVGILDIAKCVYDAIARIQHTYDVSDDRLSEVVQKLRSHFPSVTAENLLMHLREKLFLATLSVIVNEDTVVPIVRPNDTAFQAAKLMLRERMSAVMVCNEADEMIGIMTSKDLMRRVVALDVDSSKCHVSSVMTTNPYTATKDTTILETLHSMHNGQFLHVPVLDSSKKKLVGLLDVLQVTRGVVKQLGTFQRVNKGELKTLWDHYRAEFMQAKEIVSHEHHGSAEGRSIDSDVITTQKKIILEKKLGLTSTKAFTVTELPIIQSASEVYDESPVSEPIPDSFVYKIVDRNGVTHRFTSSAEDISELLHDVQHRIGDHTIRKLQYVDDDGDHVLLFTNVDLKDSVRRARTWGNKYLRLIVHMRGASLFEIPSDNAFRQIDASRQESVLGIVYYAAAAAAIAGASFFLSRRR
uniref:Myosinlike protein putative n=1 Tax=Albugo laibachii Nc14 TaxID=890382 RepID=F0W3R1_9STRA|nr:myosinlike protein putative [Albugo laibachii Nc14]|eukprot:CCA15731.1 myosinlike protein putative [Albugo laibachii Nc14]